MPSTFFGLTIGQSGLNASQIGINTTGHNISNENTKGYSRQVTDMQASTPIRSYSSSGMMGSGTDVTGISQIRELYYDRKYWSNETNYGRYEALGSYMKQLENYFNETNLEGFTKEYDNVFTSLESLKNNSSSTSYRAAFLQSCVSFTEYLNTLYNNVSNIQSDLNHQVAVTVDEINSIAASIATINKQINTVEMNGSSANDLRDKRALLIDQLSAIVPVEVTEKSLGNGVTTYDVKICNQDLVNTYSYYSLKTEPRADRANASDIEGLYEIKWANGNDFNMYSSSVNGSLKALIDMRDGCNGGFEKETDLLDANGNVVTDANGNPVKTLQIDYGTGKLVTTYKGIPYYLNQLNQFAEEFARMFNDIVTDGESQDLDGNAVTKNLFINKYDQANTVTALGIKVNDEFLNNLRLLPTGTKMVNGKENTDVVDKMLQIKKSNFLNSDSPAGYLESIVAQIATDTKIARTFESNYSSIETIIDKQRMSISGVDRDEEAMNLVKYQNAYELSSKMIQVLTEIYDRLILETGV